MVWNFQTDTDITNPYYSPVLEQQLYVNNTLIDYMLLSDGYKQDTATTLQIGKHFQGSLYGVVISDEVLTSLEMDQLYYLANPLNLNNPPLFEVDFFDPSSNSDVSGVIINNSTVDNNYLIDVCNNLTVTLKIIFLL